LECWIEGRNRPAKTTTAREESQAVAGELLGLD